MPMVLHLMPAGAWTALGSDEDVSNPSLDSEGFIHCTDDPDVLLQVANEFYRHLPGDFVVLHIDSDRLTHACVWEAPDGPAFAARFPHVYGPINRPAITAVQPAMRDASGQFIGVQALSDAAPLGSVHPTRTGLGRRRSGPPRREAPR